MRTITPTVGRVVWFYNNGQQEEPNAAIVCAVHSNTCVNLSIFEASGHSCAMQSVILVQPDDPVPVNQPHCTWMPYQIGQAKAQAENSLSEENSNPS